ncbi:hypothetical protein [Rhizobium sp. P007]|uniref:hypothetical protein n=1 Tax=Rhizobium phage RR1-A TaxID=929833 RepID=UPI0003427363|nr:hypothetical protein [Rhizobium sp. P007]YP_008130175.1 hypothetical protein RHXG_00028 [Rhizobium phage RR1-A]AGN34404.1 hypothetical protein RHXG_00028 [Rhizobium phage RR1-A]CAD7058679.1 hypothetical protein RP007_02684 [Rhizobium sp. P007]HAU74602.1 hypothetical protein [Agrobacterium sp.]
MRITYILAATVAILFIGAFILWPAFAQETEAVISPSSIWYDLWTIVQPVIVLLVSTVGPALVTWLSVRLIALLNISDEKQRVEIEARLRAALHESAINALKYAVTRTGLPLAVGSVPGQVLDAAIEYVAQKNPEALAKLGVDLPSLQDIIMSKVPEVAKAVN